MKKKTVEKFIGCITDIAAVALLVLIFECLFLGQNVSVAKLIAIWIGSALGYAVSKLIIWRVGIVWDSLPYDDPFWNHPFWGKLDNATSAMASMFRFIDSIPRKIKQMFGKREDKK